MVKSKIQISIIVPVYNEEIIYERLNYLLDLDELITKEIIIVDSSLVDDKIINNNSKTMQTIRSPKGRALQMNRGSEIAKGEILLFLHADTIIPPNSLNLITNTLNNENISGGAFDLSIDKQGFIYRIIEKISSMRSRITRIPFGDQAFFIKRNLFVDLGKFKEIPLMEDIDFLKKMRKNNHPIKILKEKVLTSPRKWEQDGVLKRTLGNWIIQILYLLGTEPEKLRRIYYGK